MDLIAEAEVTCAHCAQVFPLKIDTSQFEQTLVEDCTICCRPDHANHPLPARCDRRS